MTTQAEVVGDGQSDHRLVELESPLTESALNAVLATFFKPCGKSLLTMHISTPDGWVEMRAGERPFFVETGEDATESAANWFRAKGL